MRGIGILLAVTLLSAPAAQAQNPAAFSADTSRIEPGPPPGAKPLRRDQFDEVVARLFAAGDGNRDGTITLAEFNAAIAARRERAIRERFAAIDGDRNQALSYAEFSQWQNAMGSTVLADGVAAGGGALVAEEITIGFGDGDRDQIAERVIEPLTATALVEANEDYDSGVSLAELVAWEGRAFARFDDNSDNFVTFAELEMYRPGAPGGN